MPIESIVRVLHGKVLKGKLTLDRAALVAHLETLGDGPVEVIIRRPKRERTLDQNRFWRALVDLVAQATGNDHDSTHYDLLGECFGRQRVPVLDEHGDEIGAADVPRVGHSSTLSVAEFSRAIEWALYYLPTHLNITVPERPNDFDLGDDDDGTHAASLRHHEPQDADGARAARRRRPRAGRRPVAHGEADSSGAPRDGAGH